MFGKSIIAVNIKRSQEGGSTRTPGRRTLRVLRNNRGPVMNVCRKKDLFTCPSPQDALVVPCGPVCNILVCENVSYGNFADSSSSLHFMRTEPSGRYRSKREHCANDPALDRRIRSAVQVLRRLCLNSPNPLSRISQTDHCTSDNEQQQITPYIANHGWC